MRPWPSAYGQMGRCMAPCLNDLDPNLYRRKLDEALALFTGDGDGGTALLAHLDAQMRAAAADQRYERAAWLRRRRTRIAALVRALDGALTATHARPRLVLAPHPRGRPRYDAFWLTGGRIADWDPLDAVDDLHGRTLAALAGAGSGPPRLRGDVAEEARIAQTWLARHDSPVLDLDPAPEPHVLQAFAAGRACAQRRTRVIQ